ncbi:VOC family protein [Mesorhizobium australicum]|uniref:Glyoxalase/Bleomycin resistance protein/Dioxygenase superfamily protein n=1 Tax=Mesorhizobium australicum TaxID=536018 RepID=A0A1X7N2I5_9HYPH|nr:VOC family protein [Mesorhizobium australicum]SMH30887.1 Glyoxalase/Bleomycin resistance protein/Dioxygenase superfamily protein [Mesorhizobium australicum]
MLPLFTGVKQVCVVVEDLDATIRSYWETAGIGPWAVWTPALTGMRIRGEDTPYSMKLAMAWTDGFMWEVVQPLSGPSIYREHLDRYGEGMHHVLVQTGNHDYDDMIAEASQRGCAPLMEGNWNGTQFAYLDTIGPLKMVLEVFRRPPAYKRPEPDYCYPRRPENMPL